MQSLQDELSDVVQTLEQMAAYVQQVWQRIDEDPTWAKALSGALRYFRSPSAVGNTKDGTFIGAAFGQDLCRWPDLAMLRQTARGDVWDAGPTASAFLKFTEAQRAKMRALNNLLHDINGGGLPSITEGSGAGSNEFPPKMTPVGPTSIGGQMKALGCPSPPSSFGALQDNEAESSLVVQHYSHDDQDLEAVYVVTAGDTFDNVDDLKAALRQSAITFKFEFSITTFSATQYSVRCCNRKCRWQLNATVCRVSGRCNVIEATAHACSGTHGHSSGRPQIQQQVAKVRGSPPPGKRGYTGKDLAHDEGACCILNRTALRAPDPVFACQVHHMRGPAEQGYADLRVYCRMLREHNPGTIASVECTPGSNVFLRFFFAFGACLTGFRHCRPVIALDGAHLSGAYPGVLLGATGVDGMGRLFPVAYAIAPCENQDHWTWFLQSLREALQGVDDKDRTMTFLSDYQNGIAEAVATVYADGSHRYRMRHLIKHLKCRFKLEGLSSLMMDAARVPLESSFQSVMWKIRSLDPAIVPCLMELAPPCHWAAAHFKGARYDLLTSDVAESANNAFLVAPCQTPIPLCHTVCWIVSGWIHKRRKEARNLRGRTTPWLSQQLRETKELARAWTSVPIYGSSVFEVRLRFGIGGYVVDLDNRTCWCGEWQARGWPCMHAACTLVSCKERLEDWCDPYLSVERLRFSYEGAILPVPAAEKWIPLLDETKVMPPPRRSLNTARQPGLQPPQPKNPAGHQPRGQVERQVRTHRCSCCRKVGHNKKTCAQLPSCRRTKPVSTANAVPPGAAVATPIDAGRVAGTGMVP
ncbi:hypothetical protein CBR_g4364 [Chara braunii]|uniref:SWIM-type domain-containing protein n=1 Tax=Chara braunii TaxID=69332 RepID=A0A388KHP6_CHABU|nr:hypothetical protein CBR_g4364 [Chara braunii]|eukprot:GBG69528.1 hypothetical protein CBR_g4364 [Chara braunii]